MERKWNRGKAEQVTADDPEALPADIESDHPSDEYQAEEDSKSRKRVRTVSKPKSSRKRQRTTKSRRRRHVDDDDDDDQDDDDDDDLTEESESAIESDGSHQRPEGSGRQTYSRSGRPLRHSARQPQKYVAPDSESSEEHSDEIEDDEEKLPRAPIRLTLETSSLLVKLPISDIAAYRILVGKIESQTRPTRSSARKATRNPGSRGVSRAGSRAPSADPSLTGQRRSSRLNRDSAEPAIQLTDSGHHAIPADQSQSRITPANRPRRGGKGLKQPTVPDIVEEEPESPEAREIPNTAENIEALADWDTQPSAGIGLQVETQSQDQLSPAVGVTTTDISQQESEQLTLALGELPQSVDEAQSHGDPRLLATVPETAESLRRASQSTQEQDQPSRKRKSAPESKKSRPAKKPRRDPAQESSDFEPGQDSESLEDEDVNLDEDGDMSAADEVSDSSQNVRSHRGRHGMDITKAQGQKTRSAASSRGKSSRPGNGVGREAQWLLSSLQQPALAGTLERATLRQQKKPVYTVEPLPEESDVDEAFIRKGPNRPKGPKVTAKPILPGRRAVPATKEQLAAHRAANPEDSSNDEAPHLPDPNAYIVPTAAGQAKTAPNTAAVAVRSEAIDANQTFDKIGGLKPILEQLREMVNIPFMYGDELAKGSIPVPAQGVLFHGPPGTGKTMAARALASTLKKEGHDVTLYIKKGSDLMSKYVGEAERNVKTLFEEAQKNAPSIIFFDEFDGIAPVRGAGGSDSHHYNSIVATLLASMDGMLSRGRVVIIGATNRPDNIDPAFRRPGRFDKEFYFPLPTQSDREAILDIYTKDHPLPSSLRYTIAELTKGYSGADLKAVCQQAQMNSVKRTYPQIFLTDKRLKIDSSKIKISMKDYTVALEGIVPTTSRSGSSTFKPLPTEIQPLLAKPLEGLSHLVRKILPFRKRLTALEEAMFEPYPDADGGVAREALQMEFDSRRIYRPRCLIRGMKGMGQPMLASALLFELEGVYVQSFDLATLHQDAGKSLATIISNLFAEVKRQSPSVIFIREIDEWWANIDEESRSVFLSHLSGLADHDPIMLLATLKGSFEQADPAMVKELFSYSSKNRFEVPRPDKASRLAFFQEATSRIRKVPDEFPPSEARKKRRLEELPIAAPVALRDPREKEAEQRSRDERLMLRVREWLSVFIEGKKAEYPVLNRRMLSREGVYGLPGFTDSLPGGGPRYEFKIVAGDPVDIIDHLLGFAYPNYKWTDLAYYAADETYHSLEDFVGDVDNWQREVADLGRSGYQMNESTATRLRERRVQGLEARDEARRTVAKIRAEMGEEELQDAFGRIRKQAQELQQQQQQQVGLAGSSSTQPLTTSNAGSSGPTNSQGPGFDNYAAFANDREGSGAHTSGKLNTQSSASLVAQASKSGSNGETQQSQQSVRSLMGPPAVPSPIARTSVASIASILNDQPVDVSTSAALANSGSLASVQTGNHGDATQQSNASPPTITVDEALLSRVVNEFADRTSGCSVDQLAQIQRAIMETIWDSRSLKDRNELLRLVVKAVDVEVGDIDEIQGIVSSTPEDIEAKRRRQYEMVL